MSTENSNSKTTTSCDMDHSSDHSCYIWNPYADKAEDVKTFVSSPSPSPVKHVPAQDHNGFAQSCCIAIDSTRGKSRPLPELRVAQFGDDKRCLVHGDVKVRIKDSTKVTFLPIRPSEIPPLSLHQELVSLTPAGLPAARRRAEAEDEAIYHMFMGGMSNCDETKIQALKVLSALSGEHIGLVDRFRFSEDGYIQEHSGGHAVFFAVQGMTAAANVMKWSKCLLVCEDEIVVVLNSEGEPEQAEKILRTIIPAHPDGTPFRKMGHPCPIERKIKAPKRQAPRPILPDLTIGRRLHPAPSTPPQSTGSVLCQQLKKRIGNRKRNPRM